MEIQSTSVNFYQYRVQEQAAVQVQPMREQETAVEQRAPVDRLFISDPNLGQNVNILA